MTTVVFPGDLAQLPPGPELGTVLAALHPHRASFTHEQAETLAQAANRHAGWARAMSLSTVLDTALRTSATDPTARAAKPHRSSGPLIAVLLGCSDTSASREAGLAHDIEIRLPALLAAMLAGRISERHAKAYCRATRDLPDDLARDLVDQVLADPDTVSPADIAEEITRLAIHADPAHAEKRHRAGLEKRNVLNRLNPDGTADLNARHMPPEHAAASVDMITTLVEAARRAGDHRPLGHLREEITTGLLTRAWDAMTLTQIGALLAGEWLTRPDAPLPDDPAPPSDEDPWPGPDTDPPRSDGGGGKHRATDDPSDDHPDAWAEEEFGADHDPHVDTDPDPWEDVPDPPPGPFATGWVPDLTRPGAGIDLRLDLTTLLHHDEHPADLAGWGAVLAPLARDLTRTHAAGQWRFALVDAHGYLIAADLITARPHGYHHRQATNHAGIDIRVDPAELAELTDLTTTRPYAAWAPVLADIRRRAGTALRRPPPDPTRRFADTHLRRHITTRTPRCAWPHCRKPSTRSDVDHARDHAKGGPTDKANQWPHCKPHHTLKTNHGWDIQITGATDYDLHTHLGTRHRVTLPPTRKPLARAGTMRGRR